MEAPPPLVLFASLEKYLNALDSATLSTYQETIGSLVSKQLPPVVSIRALAVLFGYRPQFLGAIYKQPWRYYRKFEIPKGRKKRVIHAPKVALKIIQTWIAHYLSRAVLLPNYVVGFVPGKSILDGASKHCRADWVFSTDIKDFFPSTTLQSVEDALIAIGYADHGASLIAQLSSLDGGLAQGSPVSPVLSNLAFLPIDKELNAYCVENSLIYTRYADDIVISGKGDAPVGLEDFVKDRVQSGEWKLAAEKTRLDRVPNRLKAYGLLVNGESPRLTKGYRKRIRAIKHLQAQDKIPLEELAKAQGHLSYSRFVEGYKKQQGGAN